MNCAYEERDRRAEEKNWLCLFLVIGFIAKTHSMHGLLCFLSIVRSEITLSVPAKIVELEKGCLIISLLTHPVNNRLLNLVDSIFVTSNSEFFSKQKQKGAAEGVERIESVGGMFNNHFPSTSNTTAHNPWVSSNFLIGWTSGISILKVELV